MKDLLLNQRLKGKKPIGQMEIDWSHPLAKKLAVCVVGGQKKELVNGFNLKYINAAKLVGSPVGQVIDTTPILSCIELEGSEDLELTTGQTLSIFSHVSILSSDADGTIISKRNSTEAAWQLYTDEGQIGLRVGNSYQSNNASHGPTNTPITMSATWDNIAYRRYASGILKNTYPLTTFTVSNSTTISLGARWGVYPAPAYDGDFNLSIVMVWYDRVLTDDDMKSLDANPYQILKPVSNIALEDAYPILFAGGASNPVAVNDSYDVTEGVLKVVGAPGILNNDTYVCN